MAVLASPSTWRGNKPYRAYPYVYLWKAVKVFEARLNLANAVYPLTNLPFDGVTNGSYTAVEAGLTLLLGSSPGASDYGRVRVRANATSNNIPIGRTPRGVHPGELLALDNAYITVLDLAEVHAKIPYIDTVGVSLKDETSFSAGIAQPPIANGGPGVIGFVNGDGDMVVNFTAASSHAVDASASSLTYSWNFGDGLLSGVNTSTSMTPTGVVFPPGQRYVKLTVSDGTRSHRTRIPVVALERTGEYAPIRAKVTSRTNRAEGQPFTFEVRKADLPVGTYPYGTVVMCFWEEYYGSTKGSLAGTAGRQHVKFVGWLDKENTSLRATATGMEEVVTFTALDVAGRLSRLPGFGQRVVYKSSPTSWQEMANANIDRYLHHLLHWHSTALEVAPFEVSGVGANYPFMDLGSDGANLYEQVDRRAKAIACRLTCNTRGELRVKPEPQRVYIVNRTNTVIVALDERDWQMVDFEMDWHPNVHWVRSSAIVASNTSALAVFTRAPGATPGQGEGESDVGEQLVLSQFELDFRAGNDYRRANMPLKSITIRLAHGGDAGIEAAEMEWVTLGLPLAFSGPRQVAFSAAARWLVLETSYTIDPVTATVTQTLKLEPEASGLQAEAYTPVTPGSTPPTNPWSPIGSPYTNMPIDPIIVNPVVPFQPILPPTSPSMPTVPDASGSLVLIATPTNLILVRNYKQWIVNSAPVDYALVTPSLDTGYTIRHAVLSGLGVDGYCLASNGTNSILYYCPLLTAGSVSWEIEGLLNSVCDRIVTTDTDGSVYAAGFLSGSGGGGGGGGSPIECPSVNVPASTGLPGVDTGIDFIAGDRISITATGIWNFGVDAGGTNVGPDGSGSDPTCVLPSAPVMALIARVGSGAWHEIGSSGSFIAEASGTLYLMANDAPDEFSNNTGSVDAEVDCSVLGDLTEYNFAASNGGWYIAPGAPYSAGTYVSSTGWRTAYGHEDTYDNRGMYIAQDVTGVLRGFSASWTGFSAGSNNGPTNAITIVLYDDAYNELARINDPAASGTISWEGSLVTEFVVLAVRTGLHAPYNGTDPGGECTITEATLTVNSLGVGEFVTYFSDDHGATFDAPVSVDESSAGGIDSIKIGNSIVAAGAANLEKATTKGGTYADYGDPYPTGADGTLVLVPRFRPGGTTNNISTGSPYAVVGSSVLTGDDEALWTFNGTDFTDITPVYSGTPGTVVGPHCVTMPWRSGARMAGIFDFGGTRRVFTRVNTTWTYRTAISDDCHYIRMRKGDTNLRELYIANGYLAVYSPNFGVNFYSKSIPVTGNIVSLEVYG